MGKSLKGKECGKGIYQRKDGKYSARFNSKAGKRVEKYFDTISEARRWLADSVYEDQHDINVQDDEPPATEMTVNEWFDFWVNNLICDLSPNTIRNYKDRYRFNIQPVIGKKKLSDVKPMPLTRKAYQILKDCYDERETRKEADGLSQVLEYLDCRSGQNKKLFMKDLVFINYRTGMPNKNSSYDTHLYKLCDMAGIRRFCMHALRHTYATRAIERGVPPKVLQRLLGHASIKTTMDRYVHVSDDSLEKAIRLFEQECV